MTSTKPQRVRTILTQVLGTKNFDMDNECTEVHVDGTEVEYVKAMLKHRGCRVRVTARPSKRRKYSHQDDGG